MDGRVLVDNLRGTCENVCQVEQLCRSLVVQGGTATLVVLDM